MDKFNIFLITFIEISSIMILFNSFHKRKVHIIIKNLAITLITTCSVVLTESLSPEVSILINFFVFFLLIVLVLKVKVKELLIKLCIIIIFIIFIEVLLDKFMTTVSMYIKLNNKDITDLIGNIILFILCICIHFLLPNKKLLYTYIKRINRLHLGIVCLLLLYIFLVKLLWDKDVNVILENIVIITIVPVAICILSLIFMIYNEKIIYHKKSIEIYSKYNPIILNLIDEIRTRQHDFKNHLTTIYGISLTYEEKMLKSELIRYIESLQNSLVKLDEHIQIKNRVINAILYIKDNEAKQKDINFQYTVDDVNLEFSLQDYELSEVLNNLINNAFEAVNNDDNSQRNVYLKIAQTENEKYIEIGNTGGKMLLTDATNIFKRGFTTKKENEHGYGLYNVKEIVQRNKGRIELSFNQGYTIFKIVFLNF